MIKQLLEQLNNFLEDYDLVKNTNLLSKDKLLKGYNQFYNPNVGQMGTFFNKTITSGIGKRNVTGGSSVHKGLDLAYKNNEAVYSFCSGTVIFTGPMYGFGYCVIIKDSNNFRHVYAHLNKIQIKNNTKVNQGDLIGFAGGTSCSQDLKIVNKFAPHLHYGIWKPTGTSDSSAAIDPRLYKYP